MERLTRQGEIGPYWDKCVFSKHGGMEEDLIIDRLAHYEELEMTPEEIQQTLENFSAFLCEVTGNRMSKTNYTKEAMIKAVHDYFDRMCDECYARKEYARYKDLEEQGRLVELPCSVGDKVWSTLDDVGRLQECEVVSVHFGRKPHENYIALEPVSYRGKHYGASFGAIGKTVFLTRGEAEAALAASGKEV